MCQIAEPRLRALVRQPCNQLAALLAPMNHTCQQFRFAVHAIWQHTCRTKFAHCEQRGRHEPMQCCWQVEIQSEQRVKRGVPEILRGFWCSAGIPHTSFRQAFMAFSSMSIVHGVLKRVDAGLKLLPERGSRGCIHDRALTRYSKYVYWTEFSRLNNTV